MIMGFLEEEGRAVENEGGHPGGWRDGGKLQARRTRNLFIPHGRTGGNG